MSKYLAVFLFMILPLNGCSFINFSGNYYTLPANYQDEITQVWQKLQSQIPLQYDYKISVIRGKDSNRLDGVPAISDRNVLLPEDFIKYVYQNYYDDRSRILSSVILHEISHKEFNLPSKPPAVHFETDARAIALLGADKNTPDYFYKTLYVMKNYWFARKGVAGHALNTGWNAVNLASLAFGGPGMFVDWYATDLSQRMSLIAKKYNLQSKRPFPRSQ